MKRFWALILSFSLLALCFSGCSRGGTIENGANEADYPVTVNEVTLSAKPEGVAVLSDNLADVILALGYEIDLKARGEACT
ncbi:MAG: peptidoglycan-binding protein, partial [Candidatus Heritagella sp.]